MRLLAAVIGYMLFALALIHGTVSAVRWWQNQPLQTWELGLLALYPVLVWVFVTRYSIFRRGCTSCDTHR